MEDAEHVIHNMDEEKKLVAKTWTPHVVEAFQKARGEIGAIKNVLEAFGIHLDEKMHHQLFDRMLKSHLSGEESKLVHDFNSWKVDKFLAPSEREIILNYDEKARDRFIDQVEAPSPRPKPSRSI